MDRDNIIKAFTENSPNYWNVLKNENELCIKKHKEKIYPYIEERIKNIDPKLNLENIVIGVTGSDGRLESYRSETDIVVLSKENIPIEEYYNILTELKPLTIEIKTMEQTLSYYSNDPKRIFPTRMIDFLELNGDRCKRCYESFFEKFFDEIITDRKIVKSVSERFKEYLKINNSGKQRWKNREIKHYDLEQGLLYYDENPESVTFGPKYGPLRTIQFFIAKNLLQKPLDIMLGDKNKTKELYRKLFYIMPRTTIERIDFLSEELINKRSILPLSKESKNELKDNYNYFLMQYHKLQEIYFINKNRIIVTTDKKELKERINSINNIVTAQNKF
ncbi:MAG: hypothetical protein QXU20_05000 [Candidatus Woesearchaeota archaeon]